MILDWHWQNGYERAQLYDVVHAETGEEIDEPIFWADDETWNYRVFLQDGDGNFYLGPDGEPAWEERHCPLRFRLKPQYESEEQGLAWYREQLRRFRLGLDNNL